MNRYIKPRRHLRPRGARPSEPLKELIDTRPARVTTIVTARRFEGRIFNLERISRVARDCLEVEIEFEGYFPTPLHDGDLVQVIVRRRCVTRTMCGVARLYSWIRVKNRPENGRLVFWVDILPTSTWRHS